MTFLAKELMTSKGKIYRCLCCMLIYGKSKTKEIDGVEKIV